MTLLYLASPYSKYPGGLSAAFRLAVEETGRLIRAGVPAVSPIVHSHPIAMQCGIDPRDHEIWMAADAPLMAAATGLIMLQAPSWEISLGMNIELLAFRAAGKPVVWMRPGIVPAELRTL